MLCHMLPLMRVFFFALRQLLARCCHQHIVAIVVYHSVTGCHIANAHHICLPRRYAYVPGAYARRICALMRCYAAFLMLIARHDTLSLDMPCRHCLICCRRFGFHAALFSRHARHAALLYAALRSFTRDAATPFSRRCHAIVILLRGDVDSIDTT